MEVAKLSGPRPQGPCVTCWLCKRATRARFRARTHGGAVEPPQQLLDPLIAQVGQCGVDERAIA